MGGHLYIGRPDGSIEEFTGGVWPPEHNTWVAAWRCNGRGDCAAKTYVCPCNKRPEYHDPGDEDRS